MLWRRRGNIQKTHKAFLPLLAAVGPIMGSISTGATAASIGAGSMAMGAAGGAAAGYGLSQLFGGGGDDGLEIPLPDWIPDEYYKKVQEQLQPFGSDMLKGKVPDYYAPIGETGGPTFDKLMAQITGDVTARTLEQGARRNTGRGGIMTGAVAKNVGKISTQLRWDDYLRAMKGREGLLGTGLDTLSGVRAGALTNQGQRNQFELGRVGLSADITGMRLQEDQEKQQMFSDILSSVIGAAGTAYGMSKLGSLATTTGGGY